MAKACGRSQRVSIFAYSSAVPVWWAGLANKVARLSNLDQREAAYVMYDHRGAKISLFAFAKLAGESAVTAMRSTGISAYRITMMAAPKPLICSSLWATNVTPRKPWVG